MKYFLFCIQLSLIVFLFASCVQQNSTEDSIENRNSISNTAPSAQAGNDQNVSPSASVSLLGSGSDADGSIVSYAWSQVAGTSVSLNNATQASASFTAPNSSVSETLTFRLTVTDDDGATASDDVNIMIVVPNSGTVPLLFGPDITQCPVTVIDKGVGVTHVCDCQSGADASCIAGNDANPGTADAPIQSLSAAIGAFNMGSDVAFCRGGSWQTATSLFPNLANCSAANPCTLGDYGNSSLSKPRIMITSQFEAGINIDSSSNTTHWEGLKIENLHLVKSNTHDQGSGIFIYRDTNDVHMQCLDIEGFGIGVYINNDQYSTKNVTLRDSTIHDNGVFGWLGSTNSAVLERNEFNNNGYDNASAFHHNLYFSSNNSNSIIRQNYITGSALDSQGRCVGPSFIVHSGSATNLLIENNFIEEFNPGGGCWGLNVDGVGNGAKHQNVVIRGNIVKDVGNQSVGISSCIDCIIENNVVIQTKFGGSTGIAVPNRPTNAPDADNTGTIVRNNTVYFGGNGSGIAYYVGERGANYVVTNNIGYHENAILANSDSCFNFDLPTDSYDLVSSNLCFGAPFDIGTTGMDSNAMVLDPKFNNAPNDLHLVSDSPAINNASMASSAATDADNNLRDNKPDIGAYEFF